MNLQDIQQLHSFPLDDFQEEAIQVLLEGDSVIVCAPTGAGKTVVAEAAVQIALARQQRVFYTTPLKALSNQKFFDLSAALGEENVGLLTGDVSIRRDAPVVVMTTEVYRNMLYGTTLGDVGRNLRDVHFVVLDECHYMNDVDRGTVWEEAIIYAPKEFQLVALSATIANAPDLRAWMASTHGPTRLVSTDFRPVPLRHYFFGDHRLFRLLDPHGHLNPHLRGKFHTQRNQAFDKRRYPQVSDLVATLSGKDMLPAIYFVFSRRGCEEALRACKGVLKLKNRGAVAEAIEAALVDNPNLAQYPYLAELHEGLAVHHAGLLPSWKRMVERLFAQGLVQVVFATETLAAGINMPARTTVISAITRRGGEGFRSLTASEFLQMSGRAGRRGMDEIGHVVTIHRAFETPEECAHLAVAAADPLVSQFTPNYGMVLNLLQRYTMEQARTLIGLSFGQFLADSSLKPLLNELVSLQEERKVLQSPLCPAELGDLDHYRKLKEASRTEHTQMNHLKGNGAEVRAAREALKRSIEMANQEAQAMPCYQCPMQEPCGKQGSQMRKLDRRVRELSRQTQTLGSPYWSQFERLADVLTEAGYLIDSKPTEAGRMAAALRGENVLFLAEVLRSGILEPLRPEAAGAVFSALITDEVREQSVKGRLSEDALDAIEDVQRVGKRIHRLQQHWSATIPVKLNPVFAPLVEAWSHGAGWDDIRTMTVLDEGDVVRALRRCLDLTRQFMYAPDVPRTVVSLCRKLEPLLNRDEVQESMI
ncbi:MAG TPA: DEAD/DEAH box helicase [Candidatus Xenobia bacterium]|jgi:superfamily II RNA helicase